MNYTSKNGNLDSKNNYLKYFEKINERTIEKTASQVVSKQNLPPSLPDMNQHNSKRLG